MANRTNRMGLDRATVVQTAVVLSDQIGLEAVTLTELASRLNVRVPSLYNHVSGLQGLRRELALFGIHETTRRVGIAIMGKAGDDAIIGFANAYRAFIKEHPGLYAATLQAPSPDNEALQTAAQELIDIVLKVLAAYNLDKEDALHAARSIRSIVHGFATLENARGFEIPLASDESFRRLIHMFLVSLK